MAKGHASKMNEQNAQVVASRSQFDDDQKEHELVRKACTVVDAHVPEYKRSLYQKDVRMNIYKDVPKDVLIDYFIERKRSSPLYKRLKSMFVQKMQNEKKRKILSIENRIE